MTGGDRSSRCDAGAVARGGSHAGASPPRARAGSGRVPRVWRGAIESVLVSERRLSRRVRELAAQIQSDYSGRDLLVVPLLTGTIMFLADLLRELSLPLRLDFVGVSSYRGGTESRTLHYTKTLRLDAREHDVLVVDDILDTGKTLSAVTRMLRRLKPRSLRTCVLLDKPSRRVRPVQADYVGFVVPDVFVVGYGLDYAERYRNLPFVGVLKMAAKSKPNGSHA